MGNSIFIDSTATANLEEKGVVKCCLFTADQLNKLSSSVLNIHSMADNQQTDFFLSITDTNLQSKFIAEALPVFLEMIADKLSQLKVISITYHAKKNSLNSRVDIHQDWQYVNEPDFYSYTIWTPLCNVDAHNGGLFFFEGSHKVNSSLRGKGLTNNLSQYKHQEATCYPVKFGESLIFNSRLVHFSSDNKSDKFRFSIGAAVCKKEAPLSLHESVEDKIVSNQVSDEFYFLYNDFK
jgi:ectoine hydroxylase-related dioxygenase (phytanoyl-CoA dioxygenase family)